MIPTTIALARCIVAGTLCIAGFAGAQTASQLSSVTLADAVEAAWRRTIESTEAEGQLRRANADLTAASAPWAAPPALEVAHRDDRLLSGTGARETAVGVALPLWLPGQRTARLDTARAGEEAAVAARTASRHRVAGRVREAVWDITLRRAESALARARSESLEALATDVERRVAAGDLARADALAARAEAAESIAALEYARSRLDVSLLRWTELTGLSAVPEEGTAVVQASGATPGDAHPWLLAARQNVELARQRLDAVKASRRSPPELLVRLRTEVSGGAEPTNNSVGIGLRLPLATDDRNVPLIAAATAELDVAQATEQRLRTQLQADADVARTEVLVAERQIVEQQTRTRLLKERSSLVDKSFRAGETSLPEMLRVLAAAAQADADLARQRAAAGLARARLQQALGIQP